MTYPPFEQMKTTREWEPNYLPQTWTNNHYWLSIEVTLLFMRLKKIELFSPLPWRPLELEDQGVCQFSTHKHCSSAFWAWLEASKSHIQLWVAHFVECGKVSQIAHSCIKSSTSMPSPICCRIDGGPQVANKTKLWECLSFNLVINLVFLQAFIRDVVFCSLFFCVFFQVIFLGKNMFGHINYGFTNMHFIKNKTPSIIYNFAQLNYATQESCHFWLVS